MRRLTVVIAGLLASACASYPTLAERSALLAPTMEYFAPAAAGPAPLVILVSGCGGLHGLQGPKTVMKNYAGAATRAGAYVAVVDSFASRGIDFESAVGTVCSGLRLHGGERAGDIVAAEKLARERWKVAFTGVVLAGWSHGGWTVMELLAAGPDAKEVKGFRLEQPSPVMKPDAVALYYPHCSFPNTVAGNRWAFDGPLLFVNASTNAPASGRECSEAIRKSRQGSEGVEQVDFPNTHAFDEEDQVPGSEYKYDAEATQRSLALFERFVREQVEQLAR